jgi:beta-N-acetylhexosaminidase
MLKKYFLNFSLTLVAFLLLSYDSINPPKPSTSATQMDSLDLKIGQMVLMGINDCKTIDSNQTALQKEIESGYLGGIVLFEKNIAKTESYVQLKKMISNLQSHASIPLIISIDEEGGKVHRLKEKYGFVRMPSAAYLGRLNNLDSTYFYYHRLAEEMKDLGINFNFAPVVDLAINIENKVIFKVDRSFSRSPSIVAAHAIACIKAHHDNGLQTILKHFPGHGSSTSDSHLGIVDVSSTWQKDELLPYYTILNKGYCDAIMTAHIINRNWDTTLLPATLSQKVIGELLRSEMGYNGVVFSDDMQMNAISKEYGFENAIEMAINAGVDILLFGNNVHLDEQPTTATQVHQIIKKLVLSGRISAQRIDVSYQRIMKLKAHY